MSDYSLNGELKNVTLNIQGKIGIYRLAGGLSNVPKEFNGSGVLEVKYGSDKGYVV